MRISIITNIISLSLRRHNGHRCLFFVPADRSLRVTSAPPHDDTRRTEHGALSSTSAAVSPKKKCLPGRRETPRTIRSWSERFTAPIIAAAARELRRTGEGVATRDPGGRRAPGAGRRRRDPDLVVVDGHLRIRELTLRQRPVVKGDGLSYAVAAASVLAKVTRDRMMVAFDTSWPEYGFAKHKGYGTPQHLAALRTCGPSPIHRRSFAVAARA